MPGWSGCSDKGMAAYILTVAVSRVDVVAMELKCIVVRS